ncbi:hypothetical protein BsWGS_25560 [Bradybaena similaris]
MIEQPQRLHQQAKTKNGRGALILAHKYFLDQTEGLTQDMSSKTTILSHCICHWSIAQSAIILKLHNVSDTAIMFSTAFIWSPEGTRKRGRPSETLCRTITRESATIDISNIQVLQKLAIDLQSRKNMTTGLFHLWLDRAQQSSNLW